MRIPRYLVGFDSLDRPQRFTDVLVVGTGVAGLRAAIEAADAGARVLVVTKAGILESNTHHAQGGIAAALEAEGGADVGTPAEHIEDTLEVGCGLSDPEVVRTIVHEGVERVRELVSWGAEFDREDGDLQFTTEGGHRRARVLHGRGDATGEVIAEALRDAARSRDLVRLLPETFAVDLVTLEGTVRGVLLREAGGGCSIAWAGTTILATGGGGRLYRETTNPPVATADGVAMALRAGATLCDMEFVQFHPTTLYVAGAARALISEAVRGEGAHLRNRDGVRFMEEAHPRAELAPRDVVSRAIIREMRRTGDTSVYLDLAHLDADHVRERFPGITDLCASFGIDIATDRIPVRPAAHYLIGGVAASVDGETSLPGLLACGEVACTTFHGANRLGSNSLLEGMVTGTAAGRRAAREAGERDYPGPDALRFVREDPAGDRPPIDLVDLENSLRSTMMLEVGIERGAAGLDRALTRLDGWARYLLATEFAEPRGLELQNMLLVALAIARAAREREESRGVHWRTDFPDPDPAGAEHSSLRREDLLEVAE